MPFPLTILLASIFLIVRYAIYQKLCSAIESFLCRPTVAYIVKLMGYRNLNDTINLYRKDLYDSFYK